MSLAAAGLWIASLWLVVYALKYLTRRSKSLLPLSHTRRPITQVTVKHLNIRLKTNAFNAFHDELASSLSPEKSQILRPFLLRLYDLGSIVGVVGMLLAFYLLGRTVSSLSSDVLWHTGQDVHHSAGTLAKRGIGDIVSPPSPVVPTSDAMRINPIIPGLTVPLGHLPLILMALTISQVVHEAGHAITAALHRIPMLSCGIALTFIMPSAFVTLPAARLEKAPPRERLQIVSSGCFHNFVFSCLLLATAWSNFIPTRILFQDTSTLGKVVVDVERDSPLATHLLIGALIVSIDDVPMASESAPSDPWDDYLLSPATRSPRGWCTNKSLLDKALTPECSSNGSSSCFVSKEDETRQYALNAIQVFTDNLARCSSSTECVTTSSCVFPRPDQQLVRISVLRNHGVTILADTVVWKGPKEEIWEQVQVGHLRPRFSFVSYRLPKVAYAFFEYMKIANLSLYLVNMLPINALDGQQSLVALLHLFSGQLSDGPESIDLEALTDSMRFRPERRVQTACKMFLSFSALFLVVLCGLLGAIRWANT